MLSHVWLFLVTWTVAPPSSSVREIFQARMQEWVDISYSRQSSQPKIKPASLVSPTFTGGFFITGATWEAPRMDEWVSESCSVVSNSVTAWIVACQAPLFMKYSSVHGILQARILKCVAIPSSKGSSQSRDWTQVSLIISGFLPSEPLGKLKNTGVGSLSLLQWIFPTQELNWSLLNCRRMLYLLSYQGSS